MGKPENNQWMYSPLVVRLLAELRGGASIDVLSGSFGTKVYLLQGKRLRADVVDKLYATGAVKELTLDGRTIILINRRMEDEL